MGVVDLSSVTDISGAMVPKNGGEAVFVSFIVPALNEEKYIGACLESIRRLEIPPGIGGTETIVVDNHSTDRTVEVTRKLGAQVVEVAPKNASRARNAGAAAARGDWLVFVDADCELASDWMVVCSSHLIGGGRAIAVGGAAGPPRSSTPWVERAWYELSYSPSACEAKQVCWLPTFNLLVGRAEFERVGGFDETLATCEDCDLGYKLALLGPLILDPRTHAVHLGTSRSLKELFRREAWRTSGNLRLALRRPFDWPNWLSLLLPPCLVLGFIVSILAVLAAILWHWSMWPGLGLLAAIVFATALLTMRRSIPANAPSFGRRMIVFATYLAGRTAGLFRPFQRVNR